ncbi:heavy metal translocating P-type ATPase [Catenovulum sediminis]|uniref:Heavy metal translocating P-type ATPase n=1 Tax=Catenovulum sediminis TaxID=1740262 RepID=A0ABV1RJH6_9ALTE|nr:heavy metal translocating P-type ATPase [Catenovulum sediminis]
MAQNCFHCSQPIPHNVALTVEVNQQPQAVCCAGCQAVANAILGGGMSEYYRYRDSSADKPEISNDDIQQDKVYDTDSIKKEFVWQESNEEVADIAIDGLHCAACAWLIEKHLKQQFPDIISINVNLTQNRAHIRWLKDQIKVSELFYQIRTIGYLPSPFKISELENKYHQINKSFQKQLAVAGLFTMQVMMFAFALYFGIVEQGFAEFFRWISLILSTPVIFYSGLPLIHSAYRALKNRSLNMDVPVVFAILGTYFASAYATFTQAGEVYFESASMFVLLLLTSRYLEHLAKTKATVISANMLKLLPMVAHKVKGENSTKTTVVHADTLHKGDCILVKAGQSIPADGYLLSKTCQVEEALLNGESLPIVKNKGDRVYAGSTSIDQSIYIKVSACGSATTLAKIAKHQETISTSKSKLANLADKVARQATIGVILLSLLTYIVWTWLGENALWYAVAVLVATCPCALSLALPTALSAASARLKKQGILIRNTSALENACKINRFAFDKTGTLTDGKFSIESVILYPSCNLTQQELLNHVAALEKPSGHPIASAFTDFKADIPIENYQLLAGVGIQATIAKQTWQVGSVRLVNKAASEHLKNLDDTQIYVLIDGQLIAHINVTDNIRNRVKESLTALDAPVYILSGDVHTKVKNTAMQLNTGYYASLTAKQKLSILKDLKDSQGGIMMVGDGINDALVLAQADISVAMNEAAELNKQNTDVVLLGSDLSKIPLLIATSKKLNRIVNQNFSWSIVYNLLALPLAVFGILTPWMAVIGMSVSSLIVVTNSMRLLKE